MSETAFKDDRRNLTVKDEGVNRSPNFSIGPTSVFGLNDERVQFLFEEAVRRSGGREGCHGNGDPMAESMLKTLLDSELIDAKAKAFLRHVLDNPLQHPHDHAFDRGISSPLARVEYLRVHFKQGLVTDVPATSGGRGSYHNWHRYGNVFVDYRWQPQSYSEYGEAELHIAIGHPKLLEALDANKSD